MPQPHCHPEQKAGLTPQGSRRGEQAAVTIPEVLRLEWRLVVLKHHGPRCGMCNLVEVVQAEYALREVCRGVHVLVGAPQQRRALRATSMRSEVNYIYLPARPAFRSKFLVFRAATNGLSTCSIYYRFKQVNHHYGVGMASELSCR